MMFHFNFSGSTNSLYFAISTIRQGLTGLQVSGTIGDGSAEAWFEAAVGEKLKVQVLPIWDAGEESLCQRYDQSQLEQELAEAFNDVSFRSEGMFDRATGLWQRQIVAELTPPPLFCLAERSCRPHQQVCEQGPIWQRQLATRA